MRLAPAQQLMPQLQSMHCSTQMLWRYSIQGELYIRSTMLSQQKLFGTVCDHMQTSLDQSY
jgi:hypothetical protein